LVNQRIGGKVLFPLLGRFSLESGLFLDKLSYKNKDDHPSSYIIDSDNVLSIDKHTMIKLGVPLNLLCRTYQTEACVTFLKLTWNNSVMIHEQEKFVEEFNDDFSTQSRSASMLSNSQSGFDFSNSELEFSFGTYLRVNGIDAQFAIEPKFSIYNYVAANTVNTRPDLNLYEAHARIYGSMGIELTMYKIIE